MAENSPQGARAATDAPVPDWTLEQWRTICSQAPTRIAVLDPELRYIAASPGWIEGFGRGDPDLAGKGFHDVHPGIRRSWRSALARASGGLAGTSEGEHRVSFDGEPMWIRWTCTPWTRPDGIIGGVVVSVDNVTDRVRDRHRLTLAEQELHLALGAARAGTWKLDLRTFDNDWSEQTWRLYGLEPGQVRPSFESWAQSIAPDDRTRVLESVREHIERLDEGEVEWRVNLEGRERWLMARGRPLAGLDGRVDHYVGVVIDVTDRKLSEQRLLAHTRELKTILDSIPIAISRIDRELRYVFVNREYETLFARPAAEIVGLRIDELIGSAGLATAAPAIREALAGRPATFESRLTFADGKPRTMRVSLVPDAPQPGKVDGFFLLSVDVTAERAREAELNRIRDKLDLVTGRQVAQLTLLAVAHELRQPLHAAATFAEVARQSIPAADGGPDGARAVERTSAEIRRANRVIDQFLESIGGTGVGDPTGRARVDLNAIAARGLAEFERHGAGGSGRFTFHPGSSPLEVDVNPVAIAKVLNNLLRNAVEAVESGPAQAAAAPATVSTARRGERAVLCVEDSGGGVPRGRRSTLFEPFRTSKATGLGLGLSISRFLVELEGGEIWHEPRPKGSAFFVALPLAS